MKIKDLTPTQRPREKALQYGLESLNNQELLILMLGSGSAGRQVEDIAAQVLQENGPLSNLYTLGPARLMEIEGIGQAKALQICASVELCRRALKSRVYEKPVTSLSELQEWLRAQFGYERQELFIVLFFSVSGRLLSHKVLFKGTMDHSLVHPRDIFREACLCNASSIMLVHNHPDGQPLPSACDRQTTRRLIQAAALFQIPIADHIIVSPSGCFSFAAAGLLKSEDPGSADPARKPENPPEISQNPLGKRV